MAKQSQIIIDQLAEQGFWHNDISLYLALLLKNQPIEVYHEDLRRKIELDPEQGWQFVSAWANNNNFSISKRDSRRSQVENLLSDIGNRQKLEAEAASALNSLKSKAREGTPPGATPAISSTLQKAESLQRAQIKDLESRLFDPMSTFYYNSPLLKDVGNTDLRQRAAIVLSGHPQLAAYYNSSLQTAGRTHLSSATSQIQMILMRAIPELTPLYYTLHSDDMEAKTEKTLADAKTELRKIYPGHSEDQINLKKLDSDLSHFYQLARTGSTLTDISDIINALPPAYLTQDIKGLDQTIRQIVVKAATGTHVTGSDLLTQLIRDNQISPHAALQLQFLAPRLELAEISLRSELSGDHTNTREGWSARIATTLGINPSTPWLKDKDIEAATNHFLKEYGVSSLDAAIVKELSAATSLDKFNELNNLRDKSLQRQQYHQAITSNPLFFLQNQINKFGYGLQVAKEPYDKASRRFWSNIDKIDDVIHYPQRKVANFWEDLVDGRRRILGIKTVLEFKTKTGRVLRIPILNLPGFVLDQLTHFRKNLAVKVFEWSWKLSHRGGLFTPLRAVANYAFSFIQHDGDFRATNFYFSRKIMGNFLDWGAKQLKYKSFVAMKTAVGKTALKIGNKITGGLLGKATAYLASLGLSIEGIGIFFTATLLAIDLIKTVGGFFKKFFNDESFRNKFLNWVPAIGIFLGGLGTFLAGIPAAIALGFSALVSFFGAALSGIALFFIQGIIWVGAVLLGVMLIFQVFNTTIHLDSGVSTLLATSTTTIDCFVFETAGKQFPENDAFTGSEPTEGWSPGEIATMKSVIEKMQSTYGNFIEAVCKGGDIHLWRDSSAPKVSWGGWAMTGNDLRIYNNGVSAALYTLSHELGHIYATRIGGIADFITQKLVFWNPVNQTCEKNIYPAQPTSEGMCYGENFAEGISWKISSHGSLPSTWAQWVITNIFGGK